MTGNNKTIYSFTLENKDYIYEGETGVVHPLRLNDYYKKIDSGRKASENCLQPKCSIRKFTHITEEQWKRGEVVHKLWLSLTETCNMNCKYCFGEYGQKSTNSMMSIEMAKRCIDYFFRYANKNIDCYSVRFFGGEPLLNKDVMKYAINYINERAKSLNKRISYLVTTNGTLLDNEMIRIIIDNNISVNISIDGSKKTHDCNRILKNGEGSFDKVLMCVNKFKAEEYKNVIARVTLSKTGLAAFKQDIEYLWSIGFDQIYVDLAETNKNELSIGLEDMQLLSGQMDEILKIMMMRYINKDFKALRNISDAYAFIEKRLLKEACMYFNPFTIQFTPAGDIYKCCRTINRDDIYSGNINEGIKWSDFYRQYNYDKKCGDCWAKRLCGGGCKSIEHRDVYCEFAKIVYSNSLKFYVFIKTKEGDNVIW